MCEVFKLIYIFRNRHLNISSFPDQIKIATAVPLFFELVPEWSCEFVPTKALAKSVYTKSKKFSWKWLLAVPKMKLSGLSEAAPVNKMMHHNELQWPW